MGLVQRGGRVYYYLSKRINGRVVTRYQGAGAAADLLSRFAALARDRRETEAADRRAKDDEFRGRTARYRTWLDGVAGIVADALRAAGWHQHRREWRRRRGAVMSGVAVRVGDAGTWVPAEVSAAAGPLDPDARARAGKGDRSALPAVDAYLGNPAAVALWGDVGRHVLQKWARRTAGGDLTVERAVLRAASDLRARLAGPDPSALDVLVAERVVLAWVFAHWCEYQYAGSLDGLNVRHSEFHLKRIDLAGRHLLAACRTLAKVRRSRLPDVLALVSVAPSAG